MDTGRFCRLNDALRVALSHIGLSEPDAPDEDAYDDLLDTITHEVADLVDAHERTN